MLFIWLSPFNLGSSSVATFSKRPSLPDLSPVVSSWPQSLTIIYLLALITSWNYLIYFFVCCLCRYNVSVPRAEALSFSLNHCSYNRSWHRVISIHISQINEWPQEYLGHVVVKWVPTLLTFSILSLNMFKLTAWSLEMLSINKRNF